MTLLSLTDEINKNQKEKKKYQKIQESGKTLTCDLVPKGAHARGYALQLKIKHC